MLFEQNNYADDKFTIDELLRRSWRFRNSGEFTKFFNFVARFHHYSRYNTMLVYIQNKAVTFFGGISFWKKKFGRTIKEDARPYIILAPNGPVMLVYDVFETEGKESPAEFMEKGLGRNPNKVIGRIDPETYYKAIEEAKKWGIKISFKPFNYFKGGHVTTIFAGFLEICLKENASDEENFSVLIRELAHLFLGHTGHKQIHYGKEKPIKLLHRKMSRTTEELEAETVSYLICHKLGLITQSAEYIAGYIKSDEDLLSFSYEIVVKIADKIDKLFIKFANASQPHTLPSHTSQLYDQSLSKSVSVPTHNSPKQSSKLKEK
jgi:hypothetical protein